jgi:ABC-type glycerol-3-phosphate transport system permease component
MSESVGGWGKAAGIPTYVFLTALTIWILFPIAWVVLLSLKTVPDAYTNKILPSNGLTFDNYLHTWRDVDELSKNIVNSLIVSIGTVLVVTIASVPAAYALTHLRTPLRRLMVAVIVASLFVQVRVTGLIGIFEVQKAAGLLDKAWGLIFPYTILSLGLCIYIMRGVFLTIPHELVQAAEIDGAGPWRTFFTVMLPLVWNGVAVVAMTAFYLSWGEYLLAATFVTPVEEKTIPLLLATATGGMGQWSWPSIAAVLVASLIPAFVLFGLVQRRYFDGLLEGSLK